MNVQSKPVKRTRFGDATSLKSLHIDSIGTIGSVFVRNASASAFYLQIHDLSAADSVTALAATTYVPTYPSFKIPADTTLVIDATFSIQSGALIAASSTSDTLTLVTTDDAQITAEVF